MKKGNFKFSLWIAGSALVLFGAISSCSKSSKGGGPTPTPPPTNPGGYDSSNQIQPSALVAYWGFNGNLTESKENLTPTNNGLTFVTGVKGQAVQGGTHENAVFSSAGTALPALSSFTISFWLNSNAVDTAFPSQTPGHGAQGIFFLADSSQQFGNFGIDLEPYKGSSPGANPDTLQVKLSFYSYASGVVWAGWGPELLVPASVGKWTQIVFTYNGGSGTLAAYANGVLGGVASLSGPYGPFNGTETVYANDPGSNTNVNGAPIMGNLLFKNTVGMELGTWPWDSNPALYKKTAPYSNNWEDDFHGQLDELRIYNAALNSTDVNSLYILEKAGF